MQDPYFDLEEPGTYLFDGKRSTQGFRLNRFALSLKMPANRDVFLADPAAYMMAWRLTDKEQILVRNRDWTGLLAAGGHLQAILKLAATLGLNLYHIGAHNCGVGFEEMFVACPRRVASPENFDG